MLEKLYREKLIHPPSWLINNCMYLVQMGSVAYGVSNDNSDMDIYGFTIPPKEDIFPHLRGEILDFGRQKQRFHQWQEHHIKKDTQEYDFAVYSIVKYFHLVMENNPNMIDSLFVPRRCILHCTAIGEMIRENKNIFLYKGCYHKFKGYAYSQLHKMKLKEHKYIKELIRMENQLNIPRTTSFIDACDNYSDQPEYIELYKKMIEAGGRSERCKIDGFDRKFAYHLIRLLSECEQILIEGTLRLDEKSRREQLKAIRRGDWTQEQIVDYFNTKEKQLEDIYHKSSLPQKPDEEKIKQLLLNCLEHHYGSLSKAIVVEDKHMQMLRQIYTIASEAINI